MIYRRLGSSGLQISAVSLGSWLTFGKQIEDSVAEELMTIAYDAGINFFDNAEIYANGKSELVMGEILKKKNWERSSYLLSSKVFFGTKGEKSKPNERGLSRKHILEGCEGSLKRLQTEYLDLYFCHRPDKNTPIEETVWAMNLLINQGKILYWGTSEWDASEIMEAIMVAKQNHLIGPTMEQPQYNMLNRDKMDKDYLHLFKHLGIGTTIWSPLASGLLTGKYNSASPTDTRLEIAGMEWLKDRLLRDDYFKKVDQLKTISESLNTSLAKFCLAWCLKNPNVSTVILGASKAIQLKENIECIDLLEKITPEILLKVEEVLNNKPKVSEF